MANLKEVRSRIASIKSTRQITSAMKMVSASKLRKGQNAMTSLIPYEKQLRLILNNVFNGSDKENKNNLCIPGQGKDVLVIVIASNKGLCGTFNSHLLKKTVIHLRELREKGDNVKIWLVGKKAEDFFKKTDYEIDTCFHEVIDNVTSEKAFELGHRAMEAFKNGSFRQVNIIYNHFFNAARYDFTSEQLLPVVIEDFTDESAQSSDDEDVKYIIEPSRKEIMDQLVPKVLQTYLYRILLDSYISEQGARMAAMHKATDNATELLKNLTITYNKVRQSSITNEIVEIVGGAEALNG